MGSGSANIDVSVKVDVSVKDYVAEKRRTSGRHPEVFELVAYHDGELAEAEREAIRDHLGICPECTRLILDRSRFSLAEASSDDSLLSEEDIEEQKKALRARIRQQEGPVAEVLPFPESPKSTEPSASRVRRVMIPWWYHTAVAALLLTTIGLGFWLIQLKEFRINQAVKALRPVGEVLRGANRANQIQVSLERDLVLLLPFFKEDSSTYADYRVEIHDEKGEVLWYRDALQLDEDQFVLSFPHEHRQEGSYQLHLYGLTDGKPEHLDQYDIILADPIFSDEVLPPS